MKFLFLSFLLMQISNVSAADAVYKWVDEDGHVHYGSRADNKDAEEIKIKEVYIDKKSLINKPSNATENSAQKIKRYVKSIDAEKKSKEDEKRKAEEEIEKNKIRCDASRSQLKRAINSGAIYDIDKNGKRIMLNKNQYKAAMKQASARVEKWCN